MIRFTLTLITRQNGKMRYTELTEGRSPTSLYYHLTSIDNIQSILKHGLIPNKANDGAGRYDDNRWYSLNGVYATISTDLMHEIAGSFNGDYAIVVLSISPKSSLPDEDVVEGLAKQSYVAALDLWGIDGSYYDGSYYATPDHYFEDQISNGEPATFTMKDVWKTAREEFHKRASGSNTHIPYNEKLLDTFFSLWFSYEMDNYGDDPSKWMETKDQITKLYRHNMNTGLYSKGASIRITSPITFRGRNRIVAITTGPYANDVVYGTLSSEAAAFVKEIY